MLERLLHPAVDRQDQRLSAGGGVGQIGVEGAFHAGDTVPVDVGIADDVRCERSLRIEPVGLALDGEARLADRIDRLHQPR